MNRRLIVTAILIVILVFIFIFYSKPRPTVTDNYKQPSPENVVNQYFTSWNSKDYPNMYATISDGFKKIEPTASSLEEFREYASSQGINDVNISSIKEKSNDGNTAIVDYSVEFILTTGQKKKFDTSFSLKYKQGDIIPGWKLIHPYGDNIDLS